MQSEANVQIGPQQDAIVAFSGFPVKSEPLGVKPQRVKPKRVSQCTLLLDDQRGATRNDQLTKC